jgi:tight adherence protein C
VTVKNWENSLRTSLVSQKKQRLALAELPEVLELMAVSLNAGESLFGGLARVVSRASGVLPDALKGVLASLELGSALDQELKWLAKTLPQRQVIEFSNKLSSSLRRGTPLVQMLTSLAESTRAELRNAQLKQAGRNETRMLIPLVFLILPVTVLFAIYPSIQLISTGNI